VDVLRDFAPGFTEALARSLLRLAPAFRELFPFESVRTFCFIVCLEFFIMASHGTRLVGLLLEIRIARNRPIHAEHLRDSRTGFQGLRLSAMSIAVSVRNKSRT
jgi:hypothetical protein